jgi:hypothetical protein
VYLIIGTFGWLLLSHARPVNSQVRKNCVLEEEVALERGLVAERAVSIKSESSGTVLVRPTTPRAESAGCPAKLPLACGIEHSANASARSRPSGTHQTSVPDAPEVDPEQLHHQRYDHEKAADT